ncbi:MAG: HAD-IC family P-type ATPase [Candidatus Diapherotrites archaeon]
MHEKASQEFCCLGITKTFEKMDSSLNGLSESEAQKRIGKFGLNKLPVAKRFSALKLFIAQFKSLFVIILILALVLLIIMGGEEHTIDAILIAAIVMIIAVLGFWQEFKAEKAMEALKRMVPATATVLRNGRKSKINAENLVPGDIVFLETGDKVPADLRLIEGFNLKIDEALLTGESESVLKDVGELNGKKAISEMKNIAFSNTPVVYGRGMGVVIATGAETEFGNIAGLIKEIKQEETPLKKRLEVLAKQLAIAITVVVLLIVALELFYGIAETTDFSGTMLRAVALWVAAVPEGLPAVVTITLALGVQKMAAKNAIVKRMPSVESLGSITVICTDKTGTLTRNEMVVERIFADNKTYAITGEGYLPEGDFLFNGREIDIDKESALNKVLEIGLNCNDALLGEKGSIFGDPTEAAIVVAAAKAKKFTKLRRIDEIPFDSGRKMMTTIHSVNGDKTAYIKGAPESILALSSKIFENGQIAALNDKRKKELLKISEEFASDAYRMLGFAFKEVKGGGDIESDLIFAGFSAMRDPPRKEIKNAVAVCKNAGIAIKIITGDNPITARAIGGQIGLEGKAITGLELDNLNGREFSKAVKEHTIFSRVNPDHKFKIVEELMKQGEIVAVTGDGVNDAPALKKADVGIAMGIKGTDVTKESADMILEDDNFATIVSAIREGRRIYENIKNFIKYLLAANFGEVLLIALATLVRMPSPLLAVQILWINVATDSLPALALGVEGAERDTMKRPPRDPKTKILKPIITFVMIAGILAAMVSIGAFIYGSSFDAAGILDESLPSKARTMAFTTLVLFELTFVFACRSEVKLPHEINLFSNKAIIVAVTISLALQIVVVNILPVVTLNSIDLNFFRMVPLSLIEWGGLIVLSLAALAVPYIDRGLKRLLPERISAALSDSRSTVQGA